MTGNYRSLSFCYVLLNITVNEWSVMSSGTQREQYIEPTEETYFALSIEEVMTVGTDDTQGKSNG